MADPTVESLKEIIISKGLHLARKKADKKKAIFIATIEKAKKKIKDAEEAIVILDTMLFQAFKQAAAKHGVFLTETEGRGTKYPRHCRKS